MPALDFPASPTNGQVYTQDGSSWTYDSTKGAWRSSPYEPGAAITSVTAPTNPQNGDIWFDTDDGTMYVYYNDGTSSQWTEMRSQIATSQVGLVPCVPSSISVGSGTGTVNALGQVSFTGASTVSLNNVFSSAHKNYRFILNVTNSSVIGNAIFIRLRSGGADNTAASYQWMAVNTYFNGIRQLGNSGITQAEIGYTGSGDYSCFSVNDIAAPFENVKTYATNSRTYNNENSTGGWWYNNTNSFDGFSIIANSGNITGSIQVYAYNDQDYIMPLDFPSSPTNGQSYAGYVYDSSLPGWRNINSDFGVQSLNTMGLKNVVPSSVSVGSGSATVNSNGTVTFSGATSISLNDIFSSTYTNYQFNLVLTQASVADTNIWGRLRASGSDSSSAYYEGGTLQVAAALTAINNLNINQWDLGRTHSAVEPNAHASMNFKVFQPFQARPTTFYTESISWNNNNTVSFRFSGFHTTLSSYTGISLLANSGTFGGTLSVYGYTN